MCCSAIQDVIDAAVIGIPNRILGKEVAAAVQLQANATDQNLMAHLGSLLAPFKVPVRIDLVDTPLPRNPNGKIVKPEMRKLMRLD